MSSSSITKLFSQFEETIKKIDMKIRNESYRDLDTTSRNIDDMRTLHSSSLKTVNS